MGITYSQELLQTCATKLGQYQSLFPTKRRLDQSIEAELLFFVHFLFLNEEQNPIDPSYDICLQFLEPAKGLDLYGVRYEAIRRYFALIEKTIPDIPVAQQKLNYPDSYHLWRWRDYARQQHQRSRHSFSQATTKRIVYLERNSIPYYTVLKAAFPRDKVQADDVFSESHREIVTLLKRILPKQQDGKYKFLDYGCGDGRLLWVLRQHFPNAEMVATDILEGTDLIEQIRSDPLIKVVISTVEDHSTAENDYDAVLSTEVIEHLVQPEQMIKNAYKALKPGGAFIISAPSVHYEFLSQNPFTYLWSLLSTVWDGALPRFHNMWQPLSHLCLVHYAFSYVGYQKMFQKYFKTTAVITTRFTHLKKFRLERLAPTIPILKRWGGVLVAYGNKPSVHQ